MQSNPPLGRAPPMLEEIDALPGPERHAPVRDRDGELRLSQCRTEVCRHVVGTLVIMLVVAAFRREPGEIGLEIAAGRRGGILLDHERSRRMAAEEGKQSLADATRLYPARDLGREFMQA